MENAEELQASEATPADVVVVGGGVIGLTIARALVQRNARVLLMERGERLGMESSRAAAGMLAPQSEADRADEFFALACTSREMYPSFAESLREETGIDIELERTGTLYLAFTETDEREIRHRYQWQKQAGLCVEYLTAEEVRALEPCVSPHVRAALLFPLDVQVENRKLINALAASLENSNTQIWTRANVEALRIADKQIVGVETSRGFVRASLVVMACGAWTSFIKVKTASGDHNGESGGVSSNDDEALTASIRPVRGQMLCFQTQERVARHVLYSPRGYLVPRVDGRVLAGSTTEDAGFDKRVTDEGKRAIMDQAEEIAPALIDQLQLIDSWAGLRPYAADEQPVIGADRDVRGLFYATGHYRNGILLAPITGELVAKMILENTRSPLVEAFTPNRFRCAGVR